ncbi:MAG: hypothetical protein ACD_73C00027G0002, partial [uncultured bacterium]
MTTGSRKTGGPPTIIVLQTPAAALPVVVEGTAAPLHQGLEVGVAQVVQGTATAPGLRSTSGLFSPPMTAEAEENPETFKALIHELEKGSLDDLNLQDTTRHLREFWESRIKIAETAGNSYWPQYLRKPEGLRFAKAFLKFTNRILTDKPNAKGVLVFCHEKINFLIPWLKSLKDQKVLHEAEKLVVDISSQIHPSYLQRSPGQRLINPFLLVDPDYAESYKFNLASELFWYSRGNPEIEKQFMYELADLAKSAAPAVIQALYDILTRLSHLTKKDRFSADDALTVRDFADLLGRPNPMPLLANSTAFPSDAWSSVSASGFLKRAREQNNWEGKDVLEIGSGKGILSLYLAEKTAARSIDGVDINPDSRYVGLINTLLRVASGAHSNLWDRVAFYETDDLDAGAPAGKQYDVVIGCIPQAPSTHEIISDREKADVYPASDYPEDIDGFGLLSKALQRALQFNRLKPGGEYLLTVSGRPALEAVVKMANLRGWVASPVEAADILQHKGTDLSRYVEIEKSGVRLPFEFWVEGKKINATEAKRLIDEYNIKYLKAGDKEKRALEANPAYQVSHKLYVISFKPLRDFEAQIKEAAAAQVVEEIRQTKRLGYFNETGSEHEKFGLALADYLTSITSVKIPAEMLFVSTGLDRLIYNYAYTTTQIGRKIFVDPQLQISGALTQNLKNRWDVSEKFSDDVYLVISGLQGKTKGELAAKLTQAQEKSQPLLLIANQASVNELGFVTQWMLEHPGVAPYVAISWQNTQLPLTTAPLATLILPNKKIYEAMQHLGKDTYSRVSLRALYEANLLGELKALSGIQGDFSRLPRQMPGDFSEALTFVEGAQSDVSLQAHQLRTYP